MRSTFASLSEASRPLLILALALPFLALAGCSESDDDAVAERPPEKITEGVRDEDHTATKRTIHPQAATSGEIPREEEQPQTD